MTKDANALLDLTNSITLNNKDEIFKKLVSLINILITKDFEKLVFLLYRIDVNEKKLERILADSGNIDAAKIIAKLIIERQQEKIQFKKDFKNKFDSGQNTEEKW